MWANQVKQVEQKSPKKPLDVEETESALRNLALRRLSRSMITEHQLREYLARKNGEPEMIDRVIARFLSAKLLDDVEFASVWVRTRRSIRGSGPSTLRRELKQRGVADSIIDNAINDREGDDYELALALAQRRANSLRGLERDAQFRRLMGFLQRRGHTPSVALAATKEVLAAEPS
ncbi:MAG: hypothetical protein RIS43_997 [Actinomycetota bacterium]